MESLVQRNADREPVAVGIAISVEKHVAAAVLTEMETGLAPTGSLTLINLEDLMTLIRTVIGFDTNKVVENDDAHRCVAAVGKSLATA